MRDLACKEDTFAGPIDERVVEYLSERYPLGAEFLTCMASCHGGQPAIGSLKLADGTYRIAEFLTLLDEDSKLTGEFRPHFEHTRIDDRVVRSIPFLMDYDSNTSQSLFSGLVPFAATQTGMCLDRGYVDLFCLDYRHSTETPSVVLWKANEALDARFDWDKLPFEKQFGDANQFLNVNWDSFLAPIASTFGEFLELLEPNND